MRKLTLGNKSIAMGYLLAVIGSACYGLNPLFALPLYGYGASPLEVLFYRYAISAIVLGAWMLLRGQSLAITRKQMKLTLVMGFMFAVSSASLFISFKFMDAGLASVILFTYPLFVVLLSWLVFHERMSRITLACVAVAFVGICMLDNSSAGGNVSLAGLLLAVLSGFTYAIYLIGVNHSALKDMSAMHLSFYALASGTVLFFVASLFFGGIKPLPTAAAWGDALGLALLPTVVSLVLVTRAIHIIGSTPTSIIGALEPITALCISLAVFGGMLTGWNVAGIALVLGAVMLMVYSNNRRRVK